MVDFHSHVLPGMDDGSRSVEESIAMLREETKQGVKCVVATPHFYPGRENADHFLKRRNAAEEALRREMAKQEGLPKLVVGAEVFYYTGMSDSPELEKLTVQGTRSVLIEMPDNDWTPRMYRELEKIALQQGLVPVIAHIDRYIRPFRTKGIPENLAQLPVMVQANGNFFINKHTRSLALKMLRKGQIHLLGSDAHNTDTRAANLAPAAEVIRDRFGEDALGAMYTNSLEILQK